MEGKTTRVSLYFPAELKLYFGKMVKKEREGKRFSDADLVILSNISIFLERVSTWLKI